MTCQARLETVFLEGVWCHLDAGHKGWHEGDHWPREAPDLLLHHTSRCEYRDPSGKRCSAWGPHRHHVIRHTLDGSDDPGPIQPLCLTADARGHVCALRQDHEPPHDFGQETSR